MDQVPHGQNGLEAGTLDRVAPGEFDLPVALIDLEGLARGQFGMEDLLARVASFAVQAIPGADGAGVTLLRMDRPDLPVEALAGSDPLVTRIDRIQYEMVNEGPCITAALERRTVRSGCLGGEKVWPRFGPRAGRLGMNSALSLPLLLPDHVIGAINVYARDRDAFDDQAVRLGEQFAQPAAVSVHNAQVLARALDLARQLQQALLTRPVIDQAIGLLRARTGCSEQEAFERLRTISQREHRKVTEVAGRMVEEAVRRARHTPS